MEWVEKWWPEAVKAVGYYPGDQDEALSAVAMALIRVSPQRDTARNEKAWVRSIVFNTLRNVRRSQARRVMRGLAGGEPEGFEPANREEQELNPVVQILQDMQGFRGNLARAVWLQGIPIAKVADDAGLTVYYVKKWLDECRQEILQKLHENT